MTYTIQDKEEGFTIDIYDGLVLVKTVDIRAEMSLAKRTALAKVLRDDAEVGKQREGEPQ